MKCPKCDTVNPDDSKFCKECATSLTGTEDIQPAITKTIETPREELTTGSIFAGRYQIIEELGKGGMGKVYKANDTDIKERVAIKLIKPEISTDKKTIERFQNELKFARKIRHKNVCQMYDLNREEGTYYITMEYVSGEDLKSFIRRSRQLAIGTAITIAKQVCDGLSEAHKLGVVHRDLKPSNIMIDKEGDVRIMDFGIARSLETKGITGAGVMIGTPEYMSPEQAEADEVDQRSDIYSLGVILYEMVAGRLPFEGNTALSIAMKHKGEAPKDPKAYNAQLPDDLSQLILKCLAKEKEDRYQSCEGLYSALVKVEKGIPTTDRVIPKRKPITSKEITVQFNLKKILVPAFFLMALIIVSLIIWSPSGKEEAILPAEDSPSIAVLPFDDMSPQKDHEYLCDGFADELINRLSKLKRLRIPARTSSFSFKGKGISIQEIGKLLKVENILEGSIRKAGNRLRITVQLIKIADGYPIWSERYERDDTDIFALQDAISLAIVNNLKIELLGEEKTIFAKRSTQNPEAYNLYLQGRFFWWRRTEEGLKKALDYFARAIEIDPDYSLAHVGLADAYTMLHVYGFVPRQQVVDKIKVEAEEALAIDDSLAEVHTTLGNIKMYYDWDWEGAQQEFELAIQLNPNYSWVYGQYADCLFRTGQFAEAFKMNAQFGEHDPYNVIVNYQFAYMNYYARRYLEAEKASMNLTEKDPDFFPAFINLGRVYLQQAKYDEAMSAFQKAFSTQSVQLSEGDYYNCIVLAKMGRAEEAEKRLKKLFNLSQQADISPVVIAKIFAALDKKDEAFKWLRKANEEHDFGLSNLKVDPLLDSLRPDPRFTDLLKKVGLE